ncbi:MAG: RNA polymerase sigma factor [Sphingomonadales bacterium]
MQANSDDILWDSFRQGNKSALGALFERYYVVLYQYGIKICRDSELVNDSLQDLFIEIWQQRKPAPLLSLKAYLLKSLRYKLIRAAKKSRHIELTELDETFEMSHEHFLIQSEQDKANVEALTRELTLLSPRQQEIIFLRYYQQLSYREICEIMQIEYQVARNQLSMALKKLRTLVKLPHF